MVCSTVSFAQGETQVVSLELLKTIVMASTPEKRKIRSFRNILQVFVSLLLVKCDRHSNGVRIFLPYAIQSPIALTNKMLVKASNTEQKTLILRVYCGRPV